MRTPTVVVFIKIERVSTRYFVCVHTQKKYEKCVENSLKTYSIVLYSAFIFSNRVKPTS